MSELIEGLTDNAITIEAWFAQPRFRASAKGDVHVVEFHVAAEDWEKFCKNHPRNVPVTLTWWQTETEEAIRHDSEKASKPEKGPHGALWKRLFTAGFQSCPGVREAVDEQRLPQHSDDRDVLRSIFAVDSLSKVGPAEILAKFDTPQARAMVEQAERRVKDEEKTA